MTEPNYLESVLTPDELKAGRDRIAAANINNVLPILRTDLENREKKLFIV